MDDLILIGSSNQHLDHFFNRLAKKISLKDLRNLSYFLGVEVLLSKNGLLLFQYKYIYDLLEKTNMLNANKVLTPMSPNHVPSLQDGTSLSDATTYCSIVGRLQYLSLSLALTLHLWSINFLNLCIV